MLSQNLCIYYCVALLLFKSRFKLYDDILFGFVLCLLPTFQTWRRVRHVSTTKIIRRSRESDVNAYRSMDINYFVRRFAWHLECFVYIIKLLLQSLSLCLPLVWLQYMQQQTIARCSCRILVFFAINAGFYRKVDAIVSACLKILQSICISATLNWFINIDILGV